MNESSWRVTGSLMAQGSMAWRIVNKAADERAQVYIYDVIGEFGVSAGDFARELRDLAPKPVDIHINSEGGDVFAGLAMYAALRQYAGDIRVSVDGLAASAASFIAQAGHRIVMAKNASMFIHNARGFAAGDAEDMRKLAELLDDATQNIASIYAERSGRPLDGWLDAMKAESWYRGQAAVDAGLADEVISTPVKNEIPAPLTNSADPQPEVIDYAALFAESIALAQEEVFA